MMATPQPLMSGRLARMSEQGDLETLFPSFARQSSIESQDSFRSKSGARVARTRNLLFCHSCQLGSQGLEAVVCSLAGLDRGAFLFVLSPCLTFSYRARFATSSSSTKCAYMRTSPFLLTLVSPTTSNHIHGTRNPHRVHSGSAPPVFIKKQTQRKMRRLDEVHEQIATWVLFTLRLPHITHRHLDPFFSTPRRRRRRVVLGLDPYPVQTSPSP
ncbi:hypothetical protein CCHR01_18097 [Colletotrichum chrysophilum]|uniref:Uncharacterized protein n=1 Tax=Colletotrichum chrysophilum TaxID=1836956 RepID=A0AAD9E990_9PEZI|nr:hypothetical protein CCHR01_18097 [Colletotrichum chrysophilum]